jgi:hypothetical protein
LEDARLGSGRFPFSPPAKEPREEPEPRNEVQRGEADSALDLGSRYQILCTRYSPSMSTGKLIVLTIAWVFASITIGIVVGVILTEILVLTRLVDNGSREYTVSLNIIAFSAFAVVVTLPLVFRKRFAVDALDDD